MEFIDVIKIRLMNFETVSEKCNFPELITEILKIRFAVGKGGVKIKLRADFDLCRAGLCEIPRKITISSL